MGYILMTNENETIASNDEEIITYDEIIKRNFEELAKIREDTVMFINRKSYPQLIMLVRWITRKKNRGVGILLTEFEADRVARAIFDKEGF